MAARVLTVEVQRIYNPNVELDDMQVFIDTAHVLVEEELTSAGLSEDRLKLIELYLSAHFAVVTLEKGGVVRQKIGDAEEEYQAPGQRIKSIQGIGETRFGRQAIMLDTTGTLAALSEHPVRAQFRVMGDPTPDSSVE